MPGSFERTMCPPLALIHATLRRPLRALALPLCLLLFGTTARADASLLVYDFELARDPVRNADYLHALGFRGVVTRCKTPDDITKLSI